MLVGVVNGKSHDSNIEKRELINVSRPSAKDLDDLLNTCEWPTLVGIRSDAFTAIAPTR